MTFPCAILENHATQSKFLCAIYKNCAPYRTRRMQELDVKTKQLFYKKKHNYFYEKKHRNLEDNPQIEVELEGI